MKAPSKIPMGRVPSGPRLGRVAAPNVKGPPINRLRQNPFSPVPGQLGDGEVIPSQAPKALITPKTPKQMKGVPGYANGGLVKPGGYGNGGTSKLPKPQVKGC